MPEIDLTRLDLNLLKVFALVMERRSLTRASRALAIGQPAVSHALARLRIQLDDPLFVRSGRTMEPTERAKALYAEIAPALDRIERSLISSRAFDPGTTERTFRIGLSDDLQTAFLPRILRALTERMPKARLVVQQTDYLKAPDMLATGEASLVVGYLDRLPGSAKRRTVRRVGYRVVMDTARAEDLTLADYCAGRHVLVTFAGDLVGYIDETLAALGTTRDISLSLSNFAVIPYVLRDTAYLVTVPEHLASAFARLPGLKAAALPFASPEFDVSIAWRPAADHDPAERLVRDIVIDAVGGRTDT